MLLICVLVACRVQAEVRLQVQRHQVQEAVSLLLQQVLQDLPVCAVRLLRQQGGVRLLQ
jgi:hypothetical protein